MWLRPQVKLKAVCDAKVCRAVTEELFSLAERYKFPWYLADVKFLRGWLAAQDGNFDTGIEQMLGSARQPGGAAFGPMYAVLILEQELRAGKAEQALARIEREVDEMHTRGNSFCASELYRLHGEALQALARPDRAEAERAIREALGLAGKQSCRPLELRAATSLARLLHDNGRATEGRDVLAPVYAAFTEGFDRPDLQAAKVLLLELN